MTQRIGYSAETMRIAATLAVSSEARRRVIAAIQEMDRLTVYSGQRFDQSQHLASLLNSLDTDTYRPDAVYRKPAGDCPDCHCLKSAHHPNGCEGLGGDCPCTRTFEMVEVSK